MLIYPKYFDYFYSHLCFVNYQAYPKDERDNRRGGNSRSGPDPFYVLPPNDTPYYR